ncbi:MAG TPA: hypothetical protein VHN11_07070, partial [Xanthobacteraceae bacterium]|nr:hypothetical protein [Xanthobacteraceae bacterium]
MSLLSPCSLLDIAALPPQWEAAVPPPRGRAAAHVPETAVSGARQQHPRRIIGMIAALFAVSFLSGTSAWGEESDTVIAAGCKLSTIGTGTVSAAIDHRTLKLADGRLVRLAGIEVASRDTDATTPTPALAALIDQPIILRRLGPAIDRYGDVLAHVFHTLAGNESWLQSELIAQGYA